MNNNRISVKWTLNVLPVPWNPDSNSLALVLEKVNNIKTFYMDKSHTDSKDFSKSL